MKFLLYILEHAAHSPNIVNSVNSVLSRVSEEKRVFLSSFTNSCHCGGNPGVVEVTAADNCFGLARVHIPVAVSGVSDYRAFGAYECGLKVLVFLGEMPYKIRHGDHHRSQQCLQENTRAGVVNLFLWLVAWAGLAKPHGVR